jgi:hypothetical protein
MRKKIPFFIFILFSLLTKSQSLKLSGNLNDTAAKRCRKKGADGITSVGESYKGLWFQCEYNTSFLFHSLRATIASGTPGSFKFDVAVGFYKIKCGGIVGPYSVFNNSGSWVPTVQKYQSWQGSTPLTSFNFIVRVFLPGQTPSNWLQIS